MRRPLLVLSLLAPLVASLAAADRPARGLPPAAVAVALRSRPAHPLADARGQVPLTVRLRPGEDAAALGLLEVAPGIGARWVEADKLESFVSDQAARRPWVSPPLRLLSDVSGAKWTRAQAAHDKGHRGKGVVVGVLDTGIDVTHPDLRMPDPANPGKTRTRVAWLLDLANKPLGLHPELEQRFGCTQQQLAPCAVLSADDIDALVDGEIDGAIPPSDGVGHGTHVASIAAGNGDSRSDHKYIGVAPDATLVAARVTRSSGGQSVTDADLLNAVRFVFDRAESLDMPAVVNVSLGGDYGPHDGTSPLEEGLASFVGAEHPGRALVIAAGNSGGVLTGQDGQTYGVHTESRILPGADTRIMMTLPIALRGARGSAYVWVTFQPGDDVRVGLELNDEPIVGPFARGDQGAVDEEAGAHPYMAVINGVVADSSPLTPTTNGAVIVVDGTFNAGDRFGITLEGQGTAQLWVQGLGDAEFGSSTGGMLFLNPLKQGTVNVPASHPALLAVGCTINRLEWPTLAGPTLQVTKVGALENPPGDTICYFSGAGPNALGVSKPEISAPGGFIAAAMSRDARPGSSPSSMFSAPAGRCGNIDDCYVVDEQHAIASGTSMSAPQVTGAVALLLEQKPSLSQPELVALLQAGSRRFEGIVPTEVLASSIGAGINAPGAWDGEGVQGGPGALNIDASLELLTRLAAPSSPDLPASALLTTALTTPPPTADQSWLHLSSEFARPDGRWPITGTLMLRDADRLPADVAPGQLRLETDHATVTRPLTRVAAGLWQFQLSAPPRSGGSLLTARVLLGSQTIAERQIPIAVDIWNIRGYPSPRGGCSLAQPGAP